MPCLPDCCDVWNVARGTYGVQQSVPACFLMLHHQIVLNEDRKYGMHVRTHRRIGIKRVVIDWTWNGLIGKKSQFCCSDHIRLVQDMNDIVGSVCTR